MSQGQTPAPTLDSIPEVGLFDIPREPFGNTIRNMQLSRFHTWGFVVYRGTYADDTAWKRYMDAMKDSVQKALQAKSRLDLLWQYYDMTVIEDPRLEESPKSVIRKRFKQWRRARSVTRDGTGADSPLMNYGEFPRFTHCLYVDQKCLDSLDSYNTWHEAGEVWADRVKDGMSEFIVCALIDGRRKAAGEGPMGYPDIEGCRREYTGWMYSSLESLIELYESLSHTPLSDASGEYFRPPLVYPASTPSWSIQS